MVKTKQPLAGLQEVPINEILPDPDQPRQHMDEAGNIELARSVAKEGILQSILLRPISSTGPSRFMVVFGHRRLWAAKYNRLKTIPAQIRDITPEQALEIQIIENLQRVYINPVEESDAFHRLVSKDILTAEQIADKLGVSTKYIYDRMALQKCIPVVKEEIRLGRLSISHGKQFARLTTVDQHELWDALFSDEEDRSGVSLADMRRKIAGSFSLVLGNAVFSTTDAKLVAKAGSCEKCQKRSGCNLLLFDDIQQEDICFDKECWKKKEEAHIAAEIKRLEKAGTKVVRISATYDDAPDGVLNNEDWNEVEDGETPDAVGIIVEKNQYNRDYKIGQMLKVTIPSWHEKESPEEDDEDENNQGHTPRSIGPSSSKYVDHDEALNELVFEAIAASYMAGNSFAPDLSAYFKNQTRRNLIGLDNDNFEKLCDLCGWVKTLDEDGEFDQPATIDALLENTMDLPSLFTLADLASDFEYQNWDHDIVKQEEAAFARVGVNLLDIIQNYTASTPGYTLPE